jgi:hypothetical protein
MEYRSAGFTPIFAQRAQIAALRWKRFDPQTGSSNQVTLKRFYEYFRLYREIGQRFLGANSSEITFVTQPPEG